MQMLTWNPLTLSIVKFFDAQKKLIGSNSNTKC